ncbi:MAG TPA: hypothetical protein VM638_00350 [Actinomycetota bacterium]|nr:hypothetical protein [Actinomycetota bacterium]
MRETTVVLGLEDEALQEAVLHYLDRRPHVRVVGTEAEGAALARRISEARPKAAVVSPEVLREAPDLDGAALLVVTERETTEALRTAIRSGARGFYLWPEERESLGRETERLGLVDAPRAETSGRVVSIFGPRGGAGTTFLATHLAAACVDHASSPALVDLDAFYNDVGSALGVPSDAPTAAALAPVMGEVTAEHLERVLYRHPGGFRVLLGPADPTALSAEELTATVGAVRTVCDPVILHLPRSMDVARGAIEASDLVLVVVTLDVLAFRAAKRALDHLRELGLDRRCRLVVNRAAPAEVAPEDVERVFGMPPVAVLRRDPAVLRAQNRGELLLRRSGPLGRRVRELAGWICGGGA